MELRTSIKLRLFDFFKGRETYHFMKEFESTKNFSKDELAAYQFKKLKKLLIYAQKNIPFYEKRFKDVGFESENFENLSDFKNIPVLTRHDLQNNWENLLSNKFKISNLEKGSSSGSTGHPVIYYKDSIANSAGHAAIYTSWQLSGWNFNMKGLHIWGNPSTVNNEWKKLSSRIKSLIFRLDKFPAYKLTDGFMFQKLYDKINNGDYDFIDGYTNSIFLLANYLKNEKISLSKKLDFVLTTAENLQGYQREIIEKYLGPVYDFYGCSEVNGIAGECKYCKKYHIIDSHVYIEYENRKSGNIDSNILITDLDNYAFPLIRYKNDDLVVKSTSENICSLPFSSIEKVSGRESDILRLADGGTLSVPSFFGSMLLKKINGIIQYQIVKTSSNNIQINFVVSSDFLKSDLEIIKISLNEYLGERINYEIKFVDQINVSENGKFKILKDNTIL